jgi:hypothetical protein
MTEPSNKQRRSPSLSTAVTWVLAVIAIALVCAVGTAASGFAPGADLPWHGSASSRR